MAANPIPEGYHSLQIYLAVEDAAKAIDFYKEAFGAEETMRMPGPDGKVAHAELQIGDSKLMLSDPFPQSNVRPPSERGGADRVDLHVRRRRATRPSSRRSGPARPWCRSSRTCSGATASERSPTRSGTSWAMATHKEDLSEEEMAERSKAAMAEMG